MWRSTFATSSSSSAPRMTTPSLSHSNSLATVTPVCRLEGDGRARTFPRPFVDLSKLGRDGRSAGDANPALRQAPGGAGRPAGRGRAPGGQGQGAVRLPRPQPGPADEPGRTAGGRLRGGRLARPASEPERPTFEAAKRDWSGAPGRTLRDRARAAS